MCQRADDVQLYHAIGDQQLIVITITIAMAVD